MLLQNETVYIYRRHSANMTHDIHRMKSYVFNMFRKALKRRRENPSIDVELPTITELEQKV